jgi:peptidoglycan/LPS O-acetylase OafA/YrhL
LAVVALHSWLISGAARLDGGVLRAIVSSGWIGVDVFFVISGFLHFLPVVRANGSVGPVRGYALRRLARIVPAYYAALVAVLFLTHTVDWAGLLAHLVFLQVPFFGFTRRVGLNADQPMWTLSIEAAFYVLFPFVASRFLRHPVLWLAGALVVAQGWKLATEPHGLYWIVQFPSFAGHFALGMGVALLYARRPEALARWALAGQLATAALFVWFASRLVDTDAVRHFSANLPLAITFAGFLLFTAMRPGTLRPGPLRFVSNVSYGMYLFHILVIGRVVRYIEADGTTATFVAVFAITTAISLALGWISLVALENPVRRWATERARARK